jgi:chemotaxis protein methyltransferase CheR
MTAMAWSHPALEAVARLLAERTGLSFAPYRHAGAEMGMRRAMSRAGASEPDDYWCLLERSPAALDDLLVELTVGETYLFREPAQFAILRNRALPELLARRDEGHVFRLWSAGCASGEEAYSLAILLEQAGLGNRSTVLATDICRVALAKAKEATYGRWSLRGEGAALAGPYLRLRGDRYLVDPRIRGHVRFEYLNLALDVYPSAATGTCALDVILCRNVLIYFDRDTVRAVVRRLFEALAPGGWLVTASSDPPLGSEAPFETVLTEAGLLYRRREVRASLPDPLTHHESERRGLPPPSSATTVGASPAARPVVLPSAVSPSAPPPLDRLAEARAAFARGDYGRAAELAEPLTTHPEAAALRVRALANVDPEEAEAVCAAAVGRHPLLAELHYLHAILLLDLGREEEAARAARRVAYLDRSLAIAHFTLGSVLRRLGDADGARRSYRNARDLCAARPPDEAVPLGDGEQAGPLAEAASAALAVLQGNSEDAP